MCDCLKGEEKLVIPGDVVDESKRTLARVISSIYVYHWRAVTRQKYLCF